MTVEYAFGEGGPFSRVVARNRRMSVWAAPVVAWLPLAIAAVITALRGRPFDRTVFDLSVHARFLVAVPLLMFGERLLDGQCRGAVRELYRGELVDPDRLDAIVERARQLRDARWVEPVFLAIGLVDGQLVMWHVVSLIHGGATTEAWSFSRVWYGAVATPMILFVLLRWLWRWGVWSYLLLRVARCPITALATHPDRAAGLEPLIWPLTGFTTFVLGVGSMFAGAWGSQLLEHESTLRELVPIFIVYVLVISVIGCAPLLPFTPHLYNARRTTMFEYSAFANACVKTFHRRWMGADPGEALESQDVQGLAAIGNAFGVIQQTRLVLVAPRRLFRLWIAALVPMIPLAATTVTVEDVFRRLLGVVIGGIPL